MTNTLGGLTTEKRNVLSEDIDIMSSYDIAKTINNEDKNVAFVVETQLENIARAIDKIVEAFKLGGRLIYCGCGTAGRVGVLDASECPPTFSVSEEMVVGMIAGGKEAVFRAVEGAEDSFTLCENELRDINFCEKDVLVGISASGRSPYVVGGLQYAKKIGSFCVSVTCNDNSEMRKYADVDIATVVGPEVITGSTRMKAGTAQKMVLNMLSTGSMVRIGKVYKNLMVDLNPANEKLVERAKRIIMESTGCSYEKAHEIFELTDGKTKLSIVMIKYDLSIKEANKYLEENDGIIGRV